MFISTNVSTCSCSIVPAFVLKLTGLSSRAATLKDLLYINLRAWIGYGAVPPFFVAQAPTFSQEKRVVTDGSGGEQVKAEKPRVAADGSGGEFIKAEKVPVEKDSSKLNL